MRVAGNIIMRWRGSMVNRVPSMVTFLMLLSFAASFCFISEGLAQVEQPEAPPTPATTLKIKTSGSPSARDSLRLEIRQYSKAIAGLRDSLNLDEFGFNITDDQRLRVEETIEDFTLIIEEIGGELGEMELEIANNRISLLDDEGEGIVIDIPENLDEQLSQGFELLQKIILSEMPEEQSEKIRNSWTWGQGSRKQEPERIITRGNIIKIGENLQISAEEDVRGDVIIIFGDGEISGRVDGDVLVVFGNVRLDETAEITGEVVSVGGHLDQDQQAEVGSLTVVNPFPDWDGPSTGFDGGFGLLGLLVTLGELMLLVMLAMLVLAIVPRGKLEKVLETLQQRPVPSLGVGMIGTLVISLVGVALIGVLVLTVIGIPVALLVLVAMLLFSVLSVGVAGMIVGRRVCTFISGSCGSDWLVLFLGLILLDSISLLGAFLGLVPSLGSAGDALVIIGAGIKLGAYLFGAGALVLSGLGRR